MLVIYMNEYDNLFLKFNGDHNKILNILNNLFGPNYINNDEYIPCGGILIKENTGNEYFILDEFKHQSYDFRATIISSSDSIDNNFSNYLNILEKQGVDFQKDNSKINLGELESRILTSNDLFYGSSNFLADDKNLLRIKNAINYNFKYVDNNFSVFVMPRSSFGSNGSILGLIENELENNVYFMSPKRGNNWDDNNVYFQLIGTKLDLDLIKTKLNKENVKFKELRHLDYSFRVSNYG